MDKTIEQLQSEIEELKIGNEALVAKNKEVLAEKRKLQAKYQEVDVDSYHKLLEENESLKATLEKTQKQYKQDTEKLSNELSSKDTYLTKTILEEGLSKALLEAGVDKQFLKASLAMLKNDAKVVNKDGEYKAIIGDKDIAEFLPKWMETEGKIFTLKSPDVGAGSNGGSSGGGSDIKKYFDRNNSEFSLTKQAEILKTNPDLYKQLSKG
jgi:hypothetical protein